MFKADKDLNKPNHKHYACIIYVSGLRKADYLVINHKLLIPKFIHTKKAKKW